MAGLLSATLFAAPLAGPALAQGAQGAPDTAQPGAAQPGGGQPGQVQGQAQTQGQGQTQVPEGASEVRIGLVRLARPEPLPISLPARPAPDQGAAGARLGIEDNNTTGRFTRQHFTLADRAVADEAEALSALDEMAGAGIRLVLADLPAPLLLALADRAAEHGVLVFNTGASDDALRMEDCRANVVHVAPSRAMLADALAQYLVWKQWPRWFLIVGSHEADKRYAEAIRRAAQRFGARIVEERVFEDRGGARTTDSGIAQVQRQLPVFTQNAREHDVVVVADESEVFGPYMPFRTWMPRPVAGTDGLRPTSWTEAHDQWGAIQLQNRFRASSGRGMGDHDLQAWTAVRIVGEAATRTASVEPERMIEFIKGPQLEVAAFKGQKLTIRDWDLQLRQPVLLEDGRNVVSVSPQEGFLHQHSELDTLGYDRPETKCRL